MIRVACLLIACLVAPGLQAAEAPPWSNMTPVGQARLKVLFWSIYEATLYSGHSISGDNISDHSISASSDKNSDTRFSWPDTVPFALALEYQRDFSAADLVKETGRQWQAMGMTVPENWLEQLQEILPDVKKGDSITLHVDDAGNSTFYINAREAGMIRDPEFSRQFSAIWLSDQTTQPAMRRQLIGEEK